MVKTIGVDFDGVIHRYSKGWQDGRIYDPPMSGAIGSLQELMETYAVFIHSTREPGTIVPWLVAYGFNAVEDKDPSRRFWNDQGILLVTQRKLVAVAFIDDRAITFQDWDQAMREVKKLW